LEDRPLKGRRQRHGHPKVTALLAAKLSVYLGAVSESRDCSQNAFLFPKVGAETSTG
jgi:hypothetical protein